MIRRRPLLHRNLICTDEILYEHMLMPSVVALERSEQTFSAQFSQKELRE